MLKIENALQNYDSLDQKKADFLDLEWYEVNKTIIRKMTRDGMEVGIRRSNREPLMHGDVLYVGEDFYIKVQIKSCECIVIKPRSMREMGVVCFEIGNLHLPVYIDDSNDLNVAYEAPLYSMLENSGYDVSICNRRLLKTHVLRINRTKSFNL